MGRIRSALAIAITSAGRVLALSVGGLALLNLTGDLVRPRFDANLWWIDLRDLPEWGSFPLLWIAALLLTAYGLCPRLRPWRRRLTAVCVSLLALVALWNALTFFWLLHDGEIRAGFPVPFSLLVAAALGIILAAILGPAPVRTTMGNWIVGVLVLGCSAVGFPLAQMACFGKTDYRRPADAVVVFGARVYASGRPSDALKDRIRTACELCADGLAKRVVFSGGPGDGDVHETEAMRRMAMELDLPAEMILCDREGLNTQATVRNTVELFRERGFRRVLAVSHFYHLPRIKLAYQRAGFEVYTVPAEESYVLSEMPRYIAREVAALWFYYLRALLG